VYVGRLISVGKVVKVSEGVGTFVLIYISVISTLGAEIPPSLTLNTPIRKPNTAANPTRKTANPFL
jgi:hypothetical protein